MADETTSTFVDLLREFRGPLVENLRWRTILLSELKRDSSPENWAGKQVTVPIILAPSQGVGMGTELSTMPPPSVLETDQAVINSGIAEFAVSFSTKVVEASKNTSDTAWSKVVPLRMRMAEESFARILNEQFCGNGDALIAAATATSTGSTTVTVGAAANFYQLYPGRKVDCLVRSTGANIASGNGQGRKIVSTTATTVVLDQAVTLDSNDGLFIENSYGQAIQGIGQAAATTGLFEGINKSLVQGWQGIDASPSASSDLSLSILDRAERLYLNRAGVYGGPDMYIGDPAVIDKFQQSMTVQARWDGTKGELDTGWQGVRYRDKLLMWEPDIPANTMYGITKEDIRLYTLDDGPDWDDRTGSVLQRFTRALPVEAWLVWMLQLGFHRTVTTVKIASLNQAS
jgi:hypothetical protein